ncbi:MAG: PIN domain-containing protein [bacterium]|nr:PIN domain-containing protein [bacterium]
MKRDIVFLDTNILMDLLCHREACDEAATVINKGLCGECSLYCTSLTIANCIYNCRKTIGKEKTAVLLKKLCQFIKIAPSGQIEVDKSFISAVPDFEDALQYFSALSVEADVILTRNEKHFSFSDIPVMNCREYLKYRQSYN